MHSRVVHVYTGGAMPAGDCYAVGERSRLALKGIGPLRAFSQ